MLFIIFCTLYITYKTVQIWSILHILNLRDENRVFTIEKKINSNLNSKRHRGESLFLSYLIQDWYSYIYIDIAFPQQIIIHENPPRCSWQSYASFLRYGLSLRDESFVERVYLLQQEEFCRMLWKRQFRSVFPSHEYGFASARSTKALNNKELAMRLKKKFEGASHRIYFMNGPGIFRKRTIRKEL